MPHPSRVCLPWAALQLSLDAYLTITCRARRYLWAILLPKTSSSTLDWLVFAWPQQRRPYRRRIKNRYRITWMRRTCGIQRFFFHFDSFFSSSANPESCHIGYNTKNSQISRRWNCPIQPTPATRGRDLKEIKYKQTNQKHEEKLFIRIQETKYLIGEISLERVCGNKCLRWP